MIRENRPAWFCYHDRMRAATLSCLAVLLLAPAPPAAGETSRAALQAVGEVYGRIKAGDCPAAVTALKAGLQQTWPEVALLAGSMYENGLCLKRDWNKAIIFYTQAFHGQLPEAAERLAAGFADPANGPDAAAALWWSLQTRAKRFEACTVSAEAEKDPDRFVAELAAWPPHRLAACNYVVGVISTISAEVKYARDPWPRGVGGEVILRFLPGVPRFELRRGDGTVYLGFGVTDGDKLHTLEHGQTDRGFESMMREAAQRALRRYPQPSGIAPDSQVNVIYRFSLE